MTGHGSTIGGGWSRPVAALLWFMLAGLLYYPNWRPDAILMAGLPVIPLDIVASLVRLGLYGLDELALLSVGMLAALGAGGLLLGRLLLGQARVTLDMRGRAVFALALGIASLSLCTFFLGIAGGYRPVGLFVTAIILFCLAGMGVRDLVRIAREARKAHAPRPTALGVVFVILFLVVTLFLLSSALRPAVFYDAITYHLGVPNYYLLEGGIGYIPYDSYSNFPFMAEMLYTLGMFVHGQKLAQFTSVMMFFMCVTAAYDMARRLIPEVNPALVGIFMLSVPAFMENAVQYSCDLYLMFFSLMAVYSYLLYERSREQGFIILMGAFVGVCLGTKYIALVSILLPASAAALYAAYISRNDSPGALFKLLARFAVPALLICSPWFLKNLYYTGNPFYPAFYGLFGGTDMGSAEYAVHAMQHPSFMESAKGLIMHPYRLFFESPGYLTRYYGAASHLGILLPLLMPLGLLVRGVPRAVKLLCLFSLCLFLMWDFAFPLTRFLFPAIAVISVACAYFLWRVLNDSPRPARIMVMAAVGFSIFVNTALGFYSVKKWSKASGMELCNESDTDYLERRMNDRGLVMLSSYPVYEYINENLPAAAKALIIGDAQHLYIQRRHVYTYLSAADPFSAFREHAGDPKAIGDALKRDGITHIVFNPSEFGRLQKAGYLSYPESDNEHITEFLKSGQVRRVGSGGMEGYPVYLFELAVR